MVTLNLFFHGTGNTNDDSEGLQTNLSELVIEEIIINYSYLSFQLKATSDY